ncbi:MAG TPA: sugar phosphate isomerase/epimerase [Clostridiales bacterium]|nr:sugar phosphate isomerase/epimerase [Clostridiales bacterium]
MNIKYSVSSYSFSRLVNEGKYKEIELPALAKEMGFDGIEFAEIHNGDIDKKEYAKMLRDECERVGIEVANYAIGADFIYGSDGDIEKEIERLKGEVDIAEILGCKTMRHDATRGFDKNIHPQKGFPDALPIVIKGCRAVTEYAKTKGIRTMVENHGYFIQDSLRLEDIVCGVDNENFGLLLDMGNFLCADEDPEKAFGRLVSFAYMIHSKDFHVKSGNNIAPKNGFFTTRGGNFLRGAIIGHGDVPVLQCLNILKNANYSGYITVEFEGMEDPILGVKYGFENLKYYAQL